MAEETENPESLAEINTEPLNVDFETNDIRETFDKPLWMPWVNPDLNLSEEEILAIHKEAMDNMEEETEPDPYESPQEAPPDMTKVSFAQEVTDVDELETQEEEKYE
jgi:hypothetical protein